MVNNNKTLLLIVFTFVLEEFLIYFVLFRLSICNCFSSYICVFFVINLTLAWVMFTEYLKRSFAWVWQNIRGACFLLLFQTRRQTLNAATVDSRILHSRPNQVNILQEDFFNILKSKIFVIYVFLVNKKQAYGDLQKYESNVIGLSYHKGSERFVEW